MIDLRSIVNAVADQRNSYSQALHDILHGPCAAPCWTHQRLAQFQQQIAHDALYGADDTEHVGNWKASEQECET